MLLHIPSSLPASIAHFFVGVALLFALLGGLSLWQTRPPHGQEAAMRRPRRVYAVLMAIATGMALLVALVAYGLAE